MKSSDVDKFEKLDAQLQGTYDEISLLSKKKPDDAVNKFKLGFINTLLAQANDFLDQGYKPFVDFTLFDEDNVPQNSDVAFILSQYLQCLDKFRDDNLHWYHGERCWAIKAEKGQKADDNGFIYIRTFKPKRMKG